MARLFFLIEFIPKPDTSAGDRRLCELLKILAASHEVDVCILRNEYRPETLPGWEAGDTQERERLQNAVAGLGRYEQGLREIGVTMLPWGWKHVGAALAAKRYDVALFEYYWTADQYAVIFRKCQPGSKIICDSVDVCFARAERGVALGQESAEEAALVKKRELSAFRASDVVIAVSSDDEALIRSLPEMPPTALIPIIVPVRPRAQRAPSKECLFVGGFKHYPNVDGVLWFVENVWGKVRAAVPDAVFTVVGSHPPKEITELAETIPGVQVTGFVPDTDPYLDRCAVSVAPLRWGGGMKGKVSEAVACGVAVVTTPIGAQGFDAENGVEMIVTDDPDAFAQGVIELLQSPEKAEAMGLAGQSRLASLCSPEAVAAEVDKMLTGILPKTLPSQSMSLGWLFYRASYFTARAVLGR